MATQFRNRSISPTDASIPCGRELARFLEHLSAIENRSVNTVKAYSRDLTAFFKWLRDERNYPPSAGPERVMDVDITGYLKYLGKSNERSDFNRSM